jgi:hypothetical protein
MIGLLYFVLAVLASPFKSKIRLEAENAMLRHQLTICGAGSGAAFGLRTMIAGSLSCFTAGFGRSFRFLLSFVPRRSCVGTAGFRCYWRWKSRSLEGQPQIEAGLRALIRQISVENPLGARHASTANFSSSGLRSLNQASPSTWSNGEGRQARDGRPSCAIMLQISPPWTSSLFQPSVSICSMSSSSSDWSAEIWSGSTSPTAEWVARQITEAFPWDGAPGDMIRDRVAIVVASLAGKWIAAAVGARLFGYTPAARSTMWALTLPQVAATLAAAVVAFDTRNGAGQRMLDDTMLNAVLVLMLVTSILGPVLTERSAPGMLEDGGGAILGGAAHELLHQAGRGRLACRHPALACGSRRRV